MDSAWGTQLPVVEISQDQPSKKNKAISSELIIARVSHHHLHLAATQRHAEGRGAPSGGDGRPTCALMGAVGTGELSVATGKTGIHVIS